VDLTLEDLLEIPVFSIFLDGWLINGFYTSFDYDFEFGV
jgi:hypothetical protein